MQEYEDYCENPNRGNASEFIWIALEQNFDQICGREKYLDYIANRPRVEKLLPSGRDKRLASDRSITVRGNEWYDHSSESGGYAIDFVRKFYGCSYPEAVTLLLGGEQGEIYRPASPKKQEPKKPFALPPAHTDMCRVYAYMVKTRHIGREVVSLFAKQKLLYENCEKSQDGTKEYHNAVFVGLDENDVARHAHKRGIYTLGQVYKGNVDGCDPRHSFHWIGESERLYVFEAPVDLLSFITLHPQLREISLCLDNDEAGHKASERMKEQLAEQGYPSQRLISQGKDWN